MKFPNKINAYKETVLFGMAVILDAMEKTSSIVSLMNIAKNKGIDGSSFIDAACCLYALGKIKIGPNKGEVIKC